MVVEQLHVLYCEAWEDAIICRSALCSESYIYLHLRLWRFGADFVQLSSTACAMDGVLRENPKRSQLSS